MTRRCALRNAAKKMSDVTVAELVRGGWRHVATSDALPTRGIREVVVDDREIVIARLEDGTPAACQALCPHRQGPLALGTIYMGAIECPLHRYLYDLRTGLNRYPRNVFPRDKADLLTPLRMYPVCEADGALWIKVEADS